MDTKKFRRRMRDKVDKLIMLAETHCGHDGPVRVLAYKQEKFIEWLDEQILEAIEHGKVLAKEDFMRQGGIG